MGFHHLLQFPMPVRQEPNAYGQGHASQDQEFILHDHRRQHHQRHAPGRHADIGGNAADDGPQRRVRPMHARLLRLVTVHVTVDTSMKPNVYAGCYGVTVSSPWMAPPPPTDLQVRGARGQTIENLIMAPGVLAALDLPGQNPLR
jgi:hypothetical protein